MSVLRRLSAIMLTLLLPGWAFAARTDLVYHNPDADRIFWFVQSGDINMGRDNEAPAEHLRWLLETGIPAIDPEFLVLCGNLIDGTNGQRDPQPPYQQEWDAYRAIVDLYGGDASWLYDLPGTREAWNDPGYSFYLANSVQGGATGDIRHVWKLSFAWGDYLFLGLPTGCDAGSTYPDKPADLTAADFIWLDGLTADVEQARMAFAFGHNGLPYPLFWTGEMRLYHWLTDHGIAAYGFGHHPKVKIGDNVEYRADLLRVNGGGLGFNGECQYTIWVIDNDGISLTCAQAGDYPIVISSPLDFNLGGENGAAYPLAAGAPSVHVRALAFAPELPAALIGEIPGTSINFTLARLDDRPVYQGWFSAAIFAAGDTYPLNVTGEGLAGDTIELRFAATACFDGLDNDGDGRIDYPADDGCASSSDSSENGDNPPLAEAGANLTAAVGEVVVFDGLGSSDPDLTESLIYRWTFGDETDAAGYQENAVASHVYSTPGIYTATLTVIDERQNRSSDTTGVTVTAATADDDDDAEPAPADDSIREEDKDAAYGWTCGS